MLRAIGRRHCAQDILDAYALAREVGFQSINMDLIAGLPRDSVHGFARSLEGVLALKPENITVHTLALKKGSGLMDRPELLPSGQEVAQMVELSLDALEAGDYHPYYLYRQKYMSGSLEKRGLVPQGPGEHLQHHHDGRIADRGVGGGRRRHQAGGPPGGKDSPPAQTPKYPPTTICPLWTRCWPRSRSWLPCPADRLTQRKESFPMAYQLQENPTDGSKPTW